MEQFEIGDKVELNQNYDEWPKGTRGTVTDTERNAYSGDYEGPLLSVTTDQADQSGSTNMAAFAFRFNKVTKPEVKAGDTEYKVGERIVIKGDESGHGFPVGTQVYLLGKEAVDYESDVWLASEFKEAKPQWTGRYRSDGSPVVMNVHEKDMQPVAPLWTELEVGDTVTIKYLPTEQEFTTKVHKGQYSDLNVLGWAFDNEYDPGFEDVVLLSVEKALKPEPFKLPTTLWSQIEVTFIGGDPVARQVRHCVLVRDTDGEDMWLILSKEGEPGVGWHDTQWLEEGVNRDNHPMYEIKVLFEAEND